MKIKQARSLTGYEKVAWDCGYAGEECDYCKSIYTRHNSCNEIRTSYMDDDYNLACNKCVTGMAKAVEEGVDIIVGLF